MGTGFKPASHTTPCDFILTPGFAMPGLTRHPVEYYVASPHVTPTKVGVQ